MIFEGDETGKDRGLRGERAPLKLTTGYLESGWPKQSSGHLPLGLSMRKSRS